jgi:phosphorylase/glycogen(starch) synthase
MNSHDFLFEVSWEVCNKVGGIYTLLQSKLKQVIKNFGNNYILIGPWHERSKGFIESSSPFLDELKKKLTAKNLLCHVGFWDTAGKPTVILIEFKQRYKIDDLLYNLWVNFGIDSLGSSYDYQEPILFSTAAGEVIYTLAEEMLIQERQIVAHFHEWMCGAGLLYLKKHANKIATVFTTHATVLGRAMSQDNKTIYNLPATFDSIALARKHGVFAKHSLEKAAAHEADCFTVVSNVTADEARVILGKYPDKITRNGLDVEQKSKGIISAQRPEVRAKLLQVASLVIGRPIDANALLWVTSGRYEFHNKGFDVLLKSLAWLEKSLAENAPPIVVFFLIAANWRSKQDSLLTANLTKYQGQLDALGIATHRIDNPTSDSIIKLSHELDLKKPEHKIHIVFSDAYLQGDDGVFNITYEQIIAACDLSIFPSFYEPWGYTPLESIASSTPTITTDLSGFGCFISNLKQDYADAVFVLKRKDYNEQKVIAYLGEYLQTVVRRNHDQAYSANIRTRALQVANFADWKLFYQDYIDAYMQASKFNKLAYTTFDVTALDNIYVTSAHEAETTKPRFHTFQCECVLPEKIKKLRILAYNFWWSWHEEAKILFQKIDPILWEQVRHNPVYFLNLVSSHTLQTAANNKDYVGLYNKVIADFTNYMQVDQEAIKICNAISISIANPIAYFCMEYGIAECLPIYSGGLGILAGDYLKAMSDLSIPTIAVGLFYKRGYFRQLINAKGEQEALYETWNSNQIPMRKVNDASGKAMRVDIEILGRTVSMQIWEVIVGRVSLYLLDTDVTENIATDREITNSLYGGSREVRLLQELVLGIGGTRLLVDKLNIKPALYHLNEGHSAFLLLERIRGLCHLGSVFDEACEIVRSSSIFTTHTPVAAGNETFAEDLIKKYLQNYAVARLGITFDKLFDLALDADPKARVFSMTVLALRLTLSANAVSKLHGKVARVMWNAIWPGLLECEVPIDVVTNGVHLATWLGETMRLLYEDYLPSGWIKKQDEAIVWDKIKSIDSGKIWKAHQTQKEKLLAAIRQLLIEQYTLRNENKQLINASLKCLTNDTLLIGLARRFTAYKRNDLFLRDPQRLARVLNNEKEPAVVLIAGKAHPDDNGGRDLIREIIKTLRLDIFNGHIIFLEEYNIGLAKLLVQGVDVWLNTPILGREACGTSGMKAGINGGLNFSTKDGWWDEAYNDQMGWQIESLTSIDNIDKRDDVENMYLLETLETKIVPLYYKINRAGFNPDWVEKMKASIALVACNYNTSRMVRDYANNFYSPVVLRNEQLMQNNLKDLKKMVAWKQDINERFNTIKIKAIFINGIQDGKITTGGLLKVKLLLFSGKMTADELKVEFVLIRTNSHRCDPVIISLQRTESHEVGVLAYIAKYQIEETGFYSYGIRTLPYNQILFRQQDAGLAYWG